VETSIALEKAYSTWSPIADDSRLYAIHTTDNALSVIDPADGGAINTQNGEQIRSRLPPTAWRWMRRGNNFL